MKNAVTYTSQLHDRIVKSIDYDDSVSLDKVKSAVLKSVLIYYERHTARETCEEFGIPFCQEYVKILHHLAPKDMGLGGARKGSGQKKQIHSHK